MQPGGPDTHDYLCALCPSGGLPWPLHVCYVALVCLYVSFGLVRSRRYAAEVRGVSVVTHDLQPVPVAVAPLDDEPAVDGRPVPVAAVVHCHDVREENPPFPSATLRLAAAGPYARAVYSRNALPGFVRPARPARCNAVSITKVSTTNRIAAQRRRRRRRNSER